MIAKRHWLGAGILALVLHALVFTVFAQNSLETEGAIAPGEQGVEIDLGMLGDLGAAVETVEAEPETVESPKPEPRKPEPTPPKPEPVVTKPVPPKQMAEVSVKEEPEPEPEPEPKPELKVTEKPVTTAHNEAAPESSEVPDAKVRSTRKASTGVGQSEATGGNPGARSSYLTRVAAKLARYKRYPMMSRRRGQEGVAGLSFVVDRQGRIVESSITTSSGYPELDKAVMRMLESAAPLPKFPDDLTQQTLSVSIPVAFTLNDRR